MQSKTSYFNKTVFLKNFTHYWPIWTGYLLVCLLRMPFSLFLNLSSLSEEFLPDYEALRINALQETVYNGLRPFWIFLFACISATALFSYLCKTRRSYTFHSLPVCRETLFISNALAGLCFLIGSHLITFLTSILVCFQQQMTSQLIYLLHWLLLSSGMAFFAFALALLCVMITGHIVPSPIFFLGINYVFVGCKIVIFEFLDILLYGIGFSQSTFGDFLSPYYYLTNYFGGFLSSLWEGVAPLKPRNAYPIIGGYAIAGIVILILAFFIYKKKHLETAGDVITVPVFKPIIRWVVSFIVSAGLSFWIYFIFVPANTTVFLAIAMLIFGIIIFLLCEMILQKRFLIFKKKKLIEGGVFAVLMFVLVFLIDVDFFHVENDIPKETEIQSITFSGNATLEIAEKDFTKVRELHQLILDSKEEFENCIYDYDSSYPANYMIKYTLKNGENIFRSYEIPMSDYYASDETSILHQFAELENQPEYQLQYHFSDYYDSATFVDGFIEMYYGKDYFEGVTLDQNACKKIFEAYKADILEGNATLYGTTPNESYYNTLYLSFTLPEGCVPGSNIQIFDDEYSEFYYSDIYDASLPLSPSCVHTIQALEDLNAFDGNAKLITTEEAEKIWEVYEEDVVYYY